MIDDRSALLIRIDRLEVENETLRQKIEDFKERQSPVSIPAAWRLAKQRVSILELLMKSERVSREMILSAIPPVWENKEQRCSVFVDVQIHLLRKYLKPMNVTIDTLWGYGYAIPMRSKEILRREIRIAQ